MRLPAEPWEEAATGPGSHAAAAVAADEPWRRVVAGLQRNCQQFGSNLAELQCQAGRQLSQLRPVPLQPPAAAATARAAAAPVASLSQATAPGWGSGTAASRSSSGGAGGTVTREEVGRAAWTFLHTLAAQHPERPTRQQQRDARNLVSELSWWVYIWWVAKQPTPPAGRLDSQHRHCLLSSARPPITPAPLPASNMTTSPGFPTSLDQRHPLHPPRRRWTS